MRIPDFNLEGYDVSQFGTQIVLRLLRETPDTGGERCDVCFSDVALYNFTHTAGAVITDIAECSISDLLAEFGIRIANWNQSYGVAQWNNSIGSYENALAAQEYKAWRIESAVGFYGFVIAKAVERIGA